MQDHSAGPIFRSPVGRRKLLLALAMQAPQGSPGSRAKRPVPHVGVIGAQTAHARLRPGGTTPSLAGRYKALFNSHDFILACSSPRIKLSFLTIVCRLVRLRRFLTP